MNKRIVAILIALSMLFSFMGSNVIFASPTIGGVNGTSVDYDELNGSPVLAQPGLTIGSDKQFDENSYIEFAITGSDEYDQLGLQEVANAGAISTGDGVISVLNGVIYKGNGSTYDAIANIDSIKNGQDGQNLKIVFTRLLPNADFDIGSTGVQFNTNELAGWTISSGAYDLSAAGLNLYTQGRAYQSIAGENPTTITGPGGAYSFTTDFNYAAGFVNYYGDDVHAWAHESLETTISLNTTVVIDGTEASNGDRSLKLTSQGQVDSIATQDGNNDDRYGSAFGPVVISDPFNAKAGENLSIDWKASDAGDHYEVYGYIIETKGTVEMADDAYHNIFYSRGQLQNWKTAVGTIPNDGEYRFMFINGTFDKTGGEAVGSFLWIDNIKVYGTKYDAAVAEAISVLVTYHNTSQDPTETRTLTVRVVDEDGEGAAVTDSSVINITNQFDHPPTITTTGANPIFSNDENKDGGLFTSTSATTVEADELFDKLTLTVSGLLDGANEELIIDEHSIAIVNGNSGTTLANGIDYSVTEAAGTATIELTNMNLNDTEMNSLIDAMSYNNLAVLASIGDRVVTLTYVQDTGTADTGGADDNDSVLNIISTVNVSNVIDDLTYISRTATTADLSWTSPIGATSLQLQRSTNGGVTWQNAAHAALANNASSGVITGLTANVDYKFRLIVTGGDNAGISNTVDGLALQFDSFALNSRSTNSISLSWETVTGATALKIQVSSDNGVTWIDATHDILTVDAINAVVTDLVSSTTYKFRLAITGGEYEGYSNIVSAATSSNSSSSNNNNNTGVSQNNTIVIINGVSEYAGSEMVSIKNGVKTVDINVDENLVIKKIEEVKTGTDDNIIEIPVIENDSDKISVMLTGDIVKKMQDEDFDLSIKSDDIEYIIPAEEVGILSVADSLGIATDSLKDIEVEIKINEVDQELAKKMMESASAQDYEIIFPPVDFEVVAKVISEDGSVKEMMVSKFRQYVERVMEIPAGVDPNKITTGIVYNTDGTFSHIPTHVFVKDGKYYARLSSLTNSSYSIIWNPVTVKSVENHWSKDAVNDMASRLVIFNAETLDPNKAITRADFAEYIVRGLGLYRVGSTYDNIFKDVYTTGDRTLAILIANEYGIVTGYPEGTFRPDALITREEAMAMYSRAMKITKLVGFEQNRYENYTDYKQVGSWATSYVKEVLSAHVFNGTTTTTISPKANLTYAEAIQAIKNLLVESNLINQ